MLPHHSYSSIPPQGAEYLSLVPVDRRRDEPRSRRAELVDLMLPVAALPNSHLSPPLDCQPLPCPGFFIFTVEDVPLEFFYNAISTKRDEYR